MKRPAPTRRVKRASGRPSGPRPAVAGGVGVPRGCKAPRSDRRGVASRPVTLRPATPADLPAIAAIYHHYVARSTCTYQLEPWTAQEQSHWLEHHGPDHPVIVAERRGVVLGWAALSPFHPRAAYGHTVEDSVYVHPRHRGRGVGQALLLRLLHLARERRHHTVVALIDAAQPVSLALHRRLGFVQAGHLRQVGRKFGRWLDVIYLQILL